MNKVSLVRSQYFQPTPEKFNPRVRQKLEIYLNLSRSRLENIFFDRIQNSKLVKLPTSKLLLQKWLENFIFPINPSLLSFAIKKLHLQPSSFALPFLTQISFLFKVK